jgi:hypothetical protein
MTANGRNPNMLFIWGDHIPYGMCPGPWQLVTSIPTNYRYPN